MCVVICSNVSSQEFERYQYTNPDTASCLREHFQSVDFLPSHAFGSCLTEEILQVPVKLLTAPARARIQQHQQKLTEEQINEIFPCPLTQLLLTPVELSWENYPLPPAGNTTVDKTYTMSRTSYSPVSDASPVFGLDCEMVATASGCLEPARVTLVRALDIYFKQDAFPPPDPVIYDELVKPSATVIDYLTRHSGITESKLANANKTLADVCFDLAALLPSDAILVGHSAYCDLHALKLFHPYVIDTSVLYNLTGSRTSKTALRHLTHRYLNRVIQASSGGHCSVEDSTACLDLVRLKLARGLDFGDRVLQMGPPVNRRKPRLDTESSGARNRSPIRPTASSSGNTPAPPCAPPTSLSAHPLAPFFSVNAAPWRASLVRLMQDCGRRVVLVNTVAPGAGIPTPTDCQSDQSATVFPAVNGGEHVIRSNDKLAAREAGKLACVAALTVVTLRKFERATACTNWVEKTHYLRCLEKNVQAVYDELPSGTLALVIFPGSAVAVYELGRCYVTLKP